MSSTPPVCEWRSGAACQFSALQSTVATYDGRSLCLAHAPIGASGKTAQWMRQFVVAQAPTHDTIDFSGCVFPGSTAANSPADYPFSYVAPAVVLCTDCEFGEHVIVEFQWKSVDFSRSRFVGPAVIDHPGVSLTCVSCDFLGEVTVNIGLKTAANFFSSRFAAGLTVTNAHNCSRLIFDWACMSAVPTFPSGLPQQTTFFGTSFLKSALRAEDEGAYRSIRNAYSENRAREWEGVFYAYEKRCHRRSLRWGLARVLSALYDLTAKYGQSYERALIAFLLVQLAFGVGYSVAAGRWGIPGDIDGAVVTFTLSQVAKPFELFGARPALSSAYRAVLGRSDPSFWWTFWTFVQSIASIALLALFILALRWRFRRE